MGQFEHNQLHDLIEALHDQTVFDHPLEQFEIVETHISYILLTGNYAYKFKKPLDLGFLDFSSLEKRRHCCEEELRLNRRLAPDLYLDVIRITGHEPHPQINGDGPVLEYAVKMRQFDRNLELDKLIKQGQLTPSLIDQLATIIARFHSQAKHAPEDSPFGSLQYIWQPVAANFSRIRSLIMHDSPYAEKVNTLQAWSKETFELLKPSFKSRKAEGDIRECHGDMHLGNIVLIEGQPVIFDCIEFSDELHWIDVMSEIAFLVMDLHSHTRIDLANRLLNTYLEITGDYAGLVVLRFYMVYRALVRAKVACIRLEQEEDGAQERTEYRHYIDMALAFIKPQQPVLFINHGVSGTGKTTASQALLESLGAIRIRSDVERKRLHNLTAETKTGSAIEAGLYSQKNTNMTYSRLHDLAATILNAGYSVIVDATFLQQVYRFNFMALSEACNVPFLILDYVADEDTLKQRLKQRLYEGKNASEADLNVLAHQLKSQEPLDASEKKYCITIDTGNILQTEQIISAIHSKLT